jgi:CBS domain-containing protein
VSIGVGADARLVWLADNSGESRTKGRSAMTATIDKRRAVESFAGVPADELTVGEVMHAGVVCCAPETPARHVAGLMARHSIHCVVVRGDDEEGGLWGVVSDTDLLPLLSRGELDEHTAGGIAGTPLVTVARSDSVAWAADLMAEHEVTHLLVVVRDRPVGVISTLDLARAAAEGLEPPMWLGPMAACR